MELVRELCCVPTKSGTGGALESEIQAVRRKSRAPPSEPLTLQAAEITVAGKLGEGRWGAVYQGTWRNIPVAIKFSSPSDVEAEATLKKEFGMLKALHHERIMTCYGTFEGEPPGGWPEGVMPPAMCCELLSKGTFLSYLKENASQIQDRSYWARICQLLEDASEGIAYLHESNVMHRDIKSENLVLDSDLRVKLVDFGFCRDLAKMVQQSSKPQMNRRYTVACGTYTHMAPECMSSGDYNTSCDVFSLGIVMTEALTANHAEDLMDDDWGTRNDAFGLDVDRILAHMRAGGRLEGVPPECENLARLAGTCCALEPGERPSAREVVEKLEEIRTSLAA